ncbi:site-specific DNA-methyltransferase [Haemophilus haemoglobinophilus]|nr:site-specific DNA-methyltransferase [Canicola haemoglobinophilus]
MQKLKMHSADITAQNIEKIAALFPNCVTEREHNGKLEQAIDFDLLKQELSRSIVEGKQERYQLNWVGKADATVLANTPINKTLRPCREESVNFDSTENLFIEGDNLDALKLLQETYLGKVKMIYIDPPYNTGKDFIYKDNFAMENGEYQLESGQVDDEGNRLVVNSESNGRFHSDWLSMIYSRLKLARNLLTDDGVIFISIDDNEQANLKRICDEVLGADNFVNAVAVNMKNIAGASGGGEDKRLKKNVEVLLIYVKSYETFSGFQNVYNYIEIGELMDVYKNEGRSWKYTSVFVNEGKEHYIGSTVDGDGNEIKIFKRTDYCIKSVSELSKLESISETDVYKKYASRVFRTTMPQSSIRPRVMDEVERLNVSGDLFSIKYVPKTGKNKGVLYEQFYKGDKFNLFAWLKDVSEEIDGKLYKKEMQGTYWDFVSETKNLTKEGNIPFPNGKKPLALLKRLLEMQAEKDIIVMDFFAGSATTAHAVMQLNAEDGGNRKFIMVQINEELNPNNKDQKNAYDFCKSFDLPTNVAEISKERIRRAGQKIVQELADNQKSTEHLDIGFRVLKIDSSNMADIYYTPQQLQQGDMFNQVEHIKADRSEEDLLFQVLLDWGVDLTLPIEKRVINGKNVFFVDQSVLVACFDKEIDEELIKAITQYQPLRAVFRDDGFINDTTKINAEQLFKQLAPHSELRVI